MNTAYFHKIANIRKKQSLILNMKIESQMSNSLLDIQKYIFDFYKR
jgi:hypothetical protein